jgi:hypothetical protein
VVIPELLQALPEQVVPGGAVVGKLHSSTEAVELLNAAIPDEPSVTVGDGGAIREGSMLNSMKSGRYQEMLDQASHPLKPTIVKQPESRASKSDTTEYLATTSK